MYNEDELLRQTRRYLELYQRQLELAKKDPNEYPTPSLMAKLMGVDIDTAQELREFALNEFGQAEADWIASNATAFITEDGKTIGRSDYFHEF